MSPPQASTSTSKLNNPILPKQVGHEKHEEVSVWLSFVVGQFVLNWLCIVLDRV